MINSPYAEAMISASEWGRQHPVPRINSGLLDEIFRQPSQSIISQSRHNRRFRAENFCQTASDIIFRAAIENAKRTRRVNPLVFRVKTQKNLAERN